MNPNKTLSATTQEKRSTLKKSLDKYTTFSWGGVDAYDTYGAFIIHNDSLEFYNGASFSNEYGKSQFDSNNKSFLGVNFDIQKISFKIGVYWFMIDDYRWLMNWLNPYSVNRLVFGFNPDYGYLVKLSEVKGGTKRKIGSENGKDVYYTELGLVFDVQGTPCSIANESYHFTDWNLSGGTYKTGFATNSSGVLENPQSDLNTPIIVSIPVTLTGTNNKLGLKLSATYNLDSGQQDSTLLFDIQLENLIDRYEVEAGPQNEGPFDMVLEYQSATGLMYLKKGEDSRELLSLVTTPASGKRIASALDIRKFVLPGLFDNPDVDYLKINFELEVTEGPQLGSTTPFIMAYGRTNIA